MDVACSTRCFPDLALDRALRTAAELEFARFDLVVSAAGPHATFDELLTEPKRIIERIRLGPQIACAGVSLALEPAAENAADLLHAGGSLAKQLATAVLTIPAGDAATTLEVEAQRLAALVKVAARHGCVLCVPNAVGAVTESVERTLALLGAVPGLGLALDPTALLIGSHRDAAYDELFPHVKHVFMRDSGSTAADYQVAVGRGEIDFSKVVHLLNRAKYRGALVVDMEPHRTPDIDVTMEVRKLNRVLESLL